MSDPVIVWSIAGSDPSGGAGIQADLKTFHGLDAYGCAAITSVIAQNSTGVKKVAPVPADLMASQLMALAEDVPAKAIKVGLLSNGAQVRAVADMLRSLQVPVVYDPVTLAGTGHPLATEDISRAIRDHLLPLVTVLTPNIMEAEMLTGVPVSSFDDMLSVAKALLHMGPRAVLLKGGHLPTSSACDLFYDGTATWLRNKRATTVAFHGTGCTLSSAMAAGLAHGLAPLDAAVVAKAYVSQGIRLAAAIGHGRRPLYHGSWPCDPQDLPYCATRPDDPNAAPPFPRCDPGSLGFYLIVSRAIDIERFVFAGVRTFQLRAKDLRGAELDYEVALAVAIAKRFSVNLFINDAAREAIRHGAPGIHLGQEDLGAVDLEELRRAGVQLGISAYSWSELARAATLSPSYVGIGAVFPTETKDVKKPPLGLEGLRRMVRASPLPTVAIGGITLERAREVFNTGVDGIAVISDVHNAPDPIERARAWRQTWNELWSARQVLRGSKKSGS